MGEKIDVARYLHQKGANVDLADEDGVTPVYWVTKEENTERLELLLTEFGADPNQANNDGETPIHHAARVRNCGAVLVLGMNGADASSCTEKPLTIAAQDGYLDVVKCLVEQLGVDINRKNKTGFSAFFAAIQRGEIDVARYLHQKGADSNLAEAHGYTPVYWAAQKGKTDILELLVKEFGADPNQASNKGMMPVQVTCRFGQTRAIKKCVKSGARVDSSLLEEQSVGEEEGLTAWLRAHICAAPTCHDSAAKKCCKEVRYCSKACQKADRKRHKTQCEA